MDVKVYSTPTCPWCIKVKGFLKENNVEFEDKDVSTDQAAGEEMVEKSGQMGVPVITVGDDVVVGFDQKKLKELLDIKE